LSVDLIVDVNRREVASTGEPHLVLNRDLIDSAAARPRNAWAYGEYSVASLAASLTCGICWNHGFAQGNKRTAWTSGLVFLEMNGFSYRSPDTPEGAYWISALVRRIESEEAYAEYLALRIQPVER
jgi:death-on-curing protein